MFARLDGVKTRNNGCKNLSIFKIIRPVNEMKISISRTNENENFLKTYNENEKTK